MIDFASRPPAAPNVLALQHLGHLQHGVAVGGRRDLRGPVDDLARSVGAVTGSANVVSASASGTRSVTRAGAAGDGRRVSADAAPGG